MADSYIDNNSGSKKKYLIPLVVLMICAVSLTGAGYAYSQSNVEVDGNQVDAGSLDIDLTAGMDGVAASSDIDKNLIVVYQNTVYTVSGEKAAVKAHVDDARTDTATYASFSVKVQRSEISTDAKLYANVTLMKDGSAVALTDTLVELSNGTAVKYSDVFSKFTYKVGSGTATAITLGTDTEIASLTYSSDAATADVVINYDLVAENASAPFTIDCGSWEKATYVTAASEIQAAIDGLTVNVVFFAQDA